MTFADIPAGASVFLDSNTFVYHSTSDPLAGQACTDLLVRCRRQEVLGYTSTHVLGEVAHRLMTLEVCVALKRPQAGIGSFLKKHPAEIQKLTGFRQAVEGFCQSNIQILTIATSHLFTGLALSQQTGLLTNDAVTVALMQANNLSNLASNDGDFDRVPGITRYAPA
jgi:predicted nucleic acid-binding protein